MNEIIKLVRTYRVTSELVDQARLGEEIFLAVEPAIRFFIFKAIDSPHDAQDVLQVALKSIATSLVEFKCKTNDQFWAWCYSIARRRLYDFYRKKASNRLQPMPEEEFQNLLESSAEGSPLSPADKLDLDYALGLLIRSKPACYDYLWNHYVIGLDFSEIAEEQNLTKDNVRMRIGRCLELAHTLVS